MDTDAGTSSSSPTRHDPLVRFGSRNVRQRLSRYLMENADRVVVAVESQNLSACPFCRAVSIQTRDQVVKEAVLSYARLVETGSTDGLLALAAHATRMQQQSRWTVAEMQHILGSINRPLLPMVMEHFAAEPDAQRQSMDLLLACAELGNVLVSHHFEQSLIHEKHAAEERRQKFYREVAQLATNNRLRLVDTPECLPSPRGERVAIADARDAARLRNAATTAADAIGMEPERTKDLALAVGEAVANVIAHAGSGHASVWTDANTVFVHVQDKGNGICLDDLPKATLAAGWSSDLSLGMGFTLMLEMSDVVWLSTSEDGTTVCIEKTASQAMERGMNDYLLQKLL